MKLAVLDPQQVVGNVGTVSRLRRWAPSIILCAAVAVLFYELFLGEVIFWGTPLLQFYGWREMAFDALRHGRLPLWNPLVGNGAPLLANYQTAVFYPPNWLYLLIPTEYAMGWVGVLHLVWAGLGMMAYLRRLGADHLGQGVAGLAYALSGYVIGRFGFLSITSAVAWLGWLMWAVDGLVLPGEAPLRRRAGLLAGVVALMLLAGHAQTSFYSLLLAGFYAVYRALTAGTPDRRQTARRLLAALGAVMLGVAVAAVQLAPTFELMQTSQRATGVDRLAGLSYSFWPWHFLTFALPDLFGSPAAGDYWGFGAYWEDAVYVGLLPLVLAVRSLWRWAKRAQAREGAAPLQVVPFYAGLLPPVFVLALGWNTRIFPWLFDHVPTFDLFNAPARWMLLAVFGLSVLGGVGAQGWQAERERGGWPGVGTVAGIGFLIAGVAVSRMLGDAVEASFVRATLRLGVAVIAAGVLGMLLRVIEERPHLRPAWEALVLAVLAVDLVSAHWGLNPAVDPALYHERAALADLIPAGTRTLYLPGDEYAAKFEVFLSFADLQAREAAHWRGLRESLLPNLGMLDGVPSASNFDPLLVGHHAMLLEELDALPASQVAPRAAALNVGVLLSPDPGRDLGLLGRAGPMYAYTIPDPWPRAARAACDENGGELTCERTGTGFAAITGDEAQRVSVITGGEEAVWLVLVDTDYPGWRASVDGQRAAIKRANGAFRAVRVPAGEHEVVFEYRPASLLVGVVVTALGLLGMGALLR